MLLRKDPRKTDRHKQKHQNTDRRHKMNRASPQPVIIQIGDRLVDLCFLFPPERLLFLREHCILPFFFQILLPHPVKRLLIRFPRLHLLHLHSRPCAYQVEDLAVRPRISLILFRQRIPLCPGRNHGIGFLHLCKQLLIHNSAGQRFHILPVHLVHVIMGIPEFSIHIIIAHQTAADSHDHSHKTDKHCRPDELSFHDLFHFIAIECPQIMIPHLSFPPLPPQTG